MAANIPNNPPPSAPEINGNQNANQPVRGNETARKIANIAIATISIVALAALVCSLNAVAFSEGLVLTILAGTLVAGFVSAAYFFDEMTATVGHSYYMPQSRFYHYWHPLYNPPVVINSYFPRLNPIISYQRPLIIPRSVPPVRIAPSPGIRVPVGGGHAHTPIRPTPFGGRVPVGGRRL